MSPVLYIVDGSPSVRAVLMCAKALDVDLELKEVDILANEHLTPKFLKMNPQHTVPTLDDGGFIVWDSHAIMPYLVATYGKNDDLYPKDAKKRALIDQRLHFDSAVLFPQKASILRDLMVQGKKTVDEDKKQNTTEAYGFLESFLEGRTYIAGDSLTLADFSIITTLTSIDVLLPVDAKKYPKLLKYMRDIRALPIHEVNQNGLDLFTEFLQPFLNQ